MLYHVEFLMSAAKDKRREYEAAARQGALAVLARQAGDRDRAGAREVAIRLCRAGDDEALESLAALENRPLPAGSFVVADVAGRLVAALPVDVSGPVLADPFLYTAGIVELLELRAAQIRRAERRRGRLDALLARLTGSLIAGRAK